MPWHSGRVLEGNETSQCRVPCFRGFQSTFVKETFKVMTKRKWEGRREGFKVSSTREEAQGPGRPSTRGRFSESWKRLSSRQGSTKRSGLASQQVAVRIRTASVCALFFPVCWIWSEGGGCSGGTADGREEENEGMRSHRNRKGCTKESGLSRWESKGPLLPRKMLVKNFSMLWLLKGFYYEWCFSMHRTEAKSEIRWAEKEWETFILHRYVPQSGALPRPCAIWKKNYSCCLI